MTDDDITPDRLRMADWDGCYGLFTVDGREGDFRVFCCDEGWFWRSRDSTSAVRLTGMADVAARLKAALVTPE